MYDDSFGAREMLRAFDVHSNVLVLRADAVNFEAPRVARCRFAQNIRFDTTATSLRWNLLSDA